jgi:hypothetical protein
LISNKAKQKMEAARKHPNKRSWISKDLRVRITSLLRKDSVGLTIC